MTLNEYFERKALHAGVHLMPFVARQSNPVTGAAIPQSQAPSAPPSLSVI